MAGAGLRQTCVCGKAAGARYKGVGAGGSRLRRGYAGRESTGPHGGVHPAFCAACAKDESYTGSYGRAQIYGHDCECRRHSPGTLDAGSSGGRGRIVGEACHFVDLLRCLAGAPIVDMQATALGGGNAAAPCDKATFTLRFADGSMGTIHYLANGHKSFPKERLEVFCAGRILQLDNFRKLTGYGWPSFKKMSLWRQDKGQKACASAFVESVKREQEAPIPFAELIEVSRITVQAAESLRA